MFLYLVLPNLLLYLKFFTFMYILKAYNKIRSATDIISHNLSERRSTFNASRWSKISNITLCFTAYIGAHSPAVELDIAIRFRLQTGLL